jgi:hypothetical protein
MKPLADAVPFLIFATGAILLYPHRARIAEFMETFRDNFRGGPPTGPHPSPASDSALLLRRRTPKKP